MSEWSFLEPASKPNIINAWRTEAEGMLDAISKAGWEDQTPCESWQVRDVIGHLVDTTEAYFVSFNAARGNGEAPGPYGLPDMGRLADEGAKAFRDVPKDELIARLREDLERMLGIAEGLSDDEWAGLMVPHKYMGPLPASFYPTFQLVDYAIHSWDVRECTRRGQTLRAESADLLVPLCFVLWQYTPSMPEGIEPFSLGIRITSGPNAGDTRADVSAEGLTFTPGKVDDVPAVLEFDPASFVLTAYGRMNAGTTRGDVDVTDRFLNLFFRI